MSCLRLVLLVISLFLLVLLPTSALFPYTTLFRSPAGSRPRRRELSRFPPPRTLDRTDFHWGPLSSLHALLERSEEHTSELQSRGQIVCRLLLEKNKKSICRDKDQADDEGARH